MYRNFLFTSGRKNLKSSLHEIKNVYEQSGKDAVLAKSELSEKYQDDEIQSVIEAIDKITNPDSRITKYRKKLKFLLWTVFLLTAIPLPLLFFAYDLSFWGYSYSAIIDLLPSIIALLFFYSKIPGAYYVILFIQGINLLYFDLFTGVYGGILGFSFDTVFFSLVGHYIIVMAFIISVLYYSYKLSRIDDITMRIVSGNIKL